MQRNEVVELRPAFLSLAIDVVFRYCKPLQSYLPLALTHHRLLLECWKLIVAL